MSRRLLKTTPLWLIISCCRKIWADMLPNQEILNLVYLYLSDQESQLTRKEQDGKQRNSIGDVWQVFRILYNLHTMRWNGATAVWVWWSPQKSNDWHKNPKSLTMALLYLFWFNITNNNITSPKRLAYKVDWLYYLFFWRIKKIIFRLITLSLDFHRMIVCWYDEFSEFLFQVILTHRSVLITRLNIKKIWP